MPLTYDDRQALHQVCMTAPRELTSMCERLGCGLDDARFPDCSLTSTLTRIETSATVVTDSAGNFTVEVGPWIFDGYHVSGGTIGGVTFGNYGNYIPTSVSQITRRFRMGGVEVEFEPNQSLDLRSGTIACNTAVYPSRYADYDTFAELSNLKTTSRNAANLGVTGVLEQSATSIAGTLGLWEGQLDGNNVVAGPGQVTLGQIADQRFVSPHTYRCGTFNARDANTGAAVSVTDPMARGSANFVLDWNTQPSASPTVTVLSNMEAFPRMVIAGTGFTGPSGPAAVQVGTLKFYAWLDVNTDDQIVPQVPVATYSGSGPIATRPARTAKALHSVMTLKNATKVASVIADSLGYAGTALDFAGYAGVPYANLAGDMLGRAGSFMSGML